MLSFDETFLKDELANIFQAGDRVAHRTRGRGRVSNVDQNTPQGNPIVVKFDNGEEHGYTMEAAKQKLAIVTADNDLERAMSGVTRTQIRHMRQKWTMIRDFIDRPGSQQLRYTLRKLSNSQESYVALLNFLVFSKPATGLAFCNGIDALMHLRTHELYDSYPDSILLTIT